MANELKRIDLNKGTFQANGKNYYISQGLSIERYCEFQILEKELGYGVTFESLYKNLVQAFELQNKMKFAETSVLLHNLIQGIAKLEEREPVMLKIAALYINEENEDIALFSQDMITRKISDWKHEGIDVRDFFHVALGSVNGIIKIYQQLTRITSEKEVTQSQTSA